MDEQSGESEEEVVMVNEQVSWKWRNWYQNEVDENDGGITWDTRRAEVLTTSSQNVLLDALCQC